MVTAMNKAALLKANQERLITLRGEIAERRRANADVLRTDWPTSRVVDVPEVPLYEESMTHAEKDQVLRAIDADKNAADWDRFVTAIIKRERRVAKSGSAKSAKSGSEKRVSLNLHLFDVP